MKLFSSCRLTVPPMRAGANRYPALAPRSPTMPPSAHSAKSQKRRTGAWWCGLRWWTSRRLGVGEVSRFSRGYLTIPSRASKGHGERGGMTSKTTVKNQILRQSQWLAAAVVVVSLVMGVWQYDQPVFWAWVVIASLAGGHFNLMRIRRRHGKI